MDIFSHSQAILLPALLTGALFIAVLGCIADGSGFFAKAIQWLRKDPLVRVLLIVGLFSTGPITSRSKNGAPLRIAPTSQTSGAMAPFVCHEASTNGVTMVEPTTNAVVSQACLLHGASEAGEWLESAKPFFRWGTNDIRRLYASPGCLSFGTKRHPYLGDTLPNGTPAESLVVLRTPLGIVPEANWHLLEGTGVVSRFWHDALPGGGRVFTWENALLDRLSDRPATIQAELRPNGDFVYRYDFSHSAPTNAFLVGAQKAAAAVEVLRTGNAETNSATVYRLDGDTATNGVPIADLFATAPLLELRWKNTSGLGDLTGDTDGDDLTDWDEVFLHGTDPEFADTDGDGLYDNVELMMDFDPLDADENGDGIPDGTSTEEWSAHPLWAENTGETNLVVTLNEPTSALATFVVGNLSIPLSSPSSWALHLEPGQMYDFRVYTPNDEPVDIMLSPPSGEAMRTMAPRRDSPSSPSPLWQSPKDALNGPTGNTAGQLAVPIFTLSWIPDFAGSHDNGEAGVCHHSDADWVLFNANVQPNGTDLTIDDLTSEGLTQIGSRFGLRLPSSPGSAATGTILLGAKKLRWGYYQYEVSAHRLLSGLNGTHCAICDNEGIHIDDVSLAVRSPLTLKHDNEAVVSFHCEQAGHGSATNPEIKIRRVGTSQWYTLAQSFHYDWTARIAGFFELKGVATLDGATVETSPAEVEVRLPSYSDIANDYTVLVLGQNLWSKVLEDCSENGRREHGCWIALDSTTGMYFGTSFRTGEWATASTTPGVSLPLKGFYDGESGIPPPTGTGAVYPVATIHAHTPTTYTVSGREVGPSGQDQGNSLLLAAPGIVLDYLPALDAVHPMATNRIPSGHPMESPYRLYPVIPPDRRPTPP